MTDPAIAGEYLLRRYPGKGGWTYLSLPKPGWLGKKKFGHNKVSGIIDQYEFTDLSIWNTKNGDLFFPVKAEIRKAIKKEAGDLVKIAIYAGMPSSLPSDALQQLLNEEPAAARAFKKLSAGKRTELEAWINQAAGEDEKLRRLGNVLDQLAKR